jgi:hypothetical protein
MLPNREAGLPLHTDDQEGLYNRPGHLLGTVTAVDFDLWRVDVAPQEGGLLQGVQVEGDVLPEVYAPNDLASYVTYWFHDGNLQDPWCRPLHWRRFKGPEHGDAPEREKYHEHLQIKRVGQITIRISKDGKKIWLYDAESGDYCLYEQEARSFHVIGPHVFLGTDEHDRIELHTETDDDRLRVVIPKALLGRTAVASADGISYTADELLELVSTVEVRATAGELVHLIAPNIKFTAENSITLDPPRIYLGHGSAAEQVILGNLFKAYLDAFMALFSGHVHSNVQTGAGTSGPPTTPASPMPTSTLSTIARVSQ